MPRAQRVRRGDIFHVDLDPTKGSEQKGKRYVLIISPEAFNRSGVAVVCPITQGGNSARNAGFAVSLTGCGTNAQGVVLANQIRTLDLQARNASFCEAVPEYITDDVIARIHTLLD